MASELESDLSDTVDCGRKWLLDFSTGKTQLVPFDLSKSTGAIDVKTDGSVLEEKSFFNHLLTFKTLSLLLKLPPRKLDPPRKSTICPCMEYCYHVWAGAPSCYLELLNKLQKRICRTVGPSLAASLEPLVHCRNAASLSPFYRYLFGRCSSELA